MKRLAILALALGVAAIGSAQITNITGDLVELGSPPADVRLGALESNDNWHVFLESTGAVTNLAVDITAAGTINGAGDLSPGSLTGSYTSYFLHGDSVASNTAFYDWTVTFAQAIAGIIVLDGNLDSSDPTVGNAGTLYDTGLGLRGMEVGGADTLTLSADLKTVTWSGRVQGVHDDIRILTNPVPEPATMVALGLGAAAIIRRSKK